MGYAYPMANLFDYLKWRGDLSIQAAPFNDVDAFILTVLAYLPFDGTVGAEFGRNAVTIREAASGFAGAGAAHPPVRDPKDAVLLAVLGESVRFGGMGLSGYVSRTDLRSEKQFSALCVDTLDEAQFIAFRGTDSSLVGWKEDFNMSFMATVPAQADAVGYLETAASKLRCKLRIGGHSKGGNLAIYAAAFCDPKNQRRIIAVHNNDGPGFDQAVVDQKGYQDVQGRVFAYVPESSVIGMLLAHDGNYAVIGSDQTGIMQHDPYSWQILGPRFEQVASVDGRSRFVDRTIKGWLGALSPEQREKFVDALFAILSATGAKTVDELSADWLAKAWAIGKSLKNVDEPTRKMLLETASLLVKSAKESLPSLRAGTKKD
jgi:hypothetical protein